MPKGPQVRNAPLANLYSAMSDEETRRLRDELATAKSELNSLENMGPSQPGGTGPNLALLTGCKEELRRRIEDILAQLGGDQCDE